MPFDPATSKLLKRNVAMFCLESALNKSCVHTMRLAFDNQAHRLKRAGFPGTLLTSVAETLLQNKGKKKAVVVGSKTKTVIWCHIFTRLPTTSRRWQAGMVYHSPPQPRVKLGQLCPRTSDHGTRTQGCGKEHGTVYTECET